jgi:hypothetical protein
MMLQQPFFPKKNFLLLGNMDVDKTVCHHFDKTDLKCFAFQARKHNFFSLIFHYQSVPLLKCLERNSFLMRL